MEDEMPSTVEQSRQDNTEEGLEAEDMKIGLDVPENILCAQAR